MRIMPMGGRIAEAAEAGVNWPGLSTSSPYLNKVLPALERLDCLIAHAVAQAQEAYGSEARADPFRGLHISPIEVERLLTRAPGTPVLWTGVQDNEVKGDLADETSPLAWLARAFGLSSFDVDVILIALAPELDLRYERLYAYLQDDVTRRRPSVDLALNLLCASAEEKLTRRTHFAATAPAIRHGLLHLMTDPNQVRPSLLAYGLKVDEQIVEFLLGQADLNGRLATFCQVTGPAFAGDDLVFASETLRVLSPLMKQRRETHQPVRLYFHGVPGTGRRQMAQALAHAVHASLLSVDLARALSADAAFDETLRLLFRTAICHDYVVLLDSVDALFSPERALQYASMLRAVAEYTGLIIMVGQQPWTLSMHELRGVISVPFGIPDFAQRRDSWQASLNAVGIMLEGQDLDALASRFRLSPSQVAHAAATACNSALLRGMDPALDRHQVSPGLPTLDDLFAAARAQSGHDLMTLARKVQPTYTWNALVLPSDSLTQLHEICDQAKYRHVVYDEWGFDRHLSLGKDLNVLFSGPPGTGKTMAAEVIARELALDLYKIDLSRVVSKYIGETEKNLDRVFTAATTANAILFFDEADTLFGKRSAVKDANDRYANIEIGYLLQKMEEYDGIAILATNLRTNMDDAFIRRLKFSVEFPFPEEPYRYRIWQGHVPPEAPRSSDIDFAFLARQFKLSGGSIKNIVVNASFLAAAAGEIVAMRHLILATKREYQKMGRTCSEADFGAYVALVK